MVVRRGKAGRAAMKRRKAFRLRAPCALENFRAVRPPSRFLRWPAIPAPAYAAAIVAIAGGAYLNSLQVPFLLDDLTTIVANPTIRSLSPLRDVLFPPGEIYSAGRPVLNLSFALNHAIGGTAVGGYHVINLAIHLAAALVLFGLARRTLELPRGGEYFRAHAAPIAFAIAALWAAHPLLTSAVTYVSQRAESLMGLFYLLTLYAFVRGAERLSHLWLIAGTAACALGMATKEVMVTAPVLVLLYDRVFLAGSWREAWARRWPWHAAHAATWMLLIALMAGARLGQRAVGFDHGLSWFSYLCLESQAVSLYLLRAFVPVNLVFDYGANLPAPGATALLGAFALLGTLLALSVRGLRRGAAWGFLGTAFFLVLAPSSSVVPLAGQPIAESRAYLPLAAVIALSIAALVRFLPRLSPLLLAGALATLALLTHRRNEVYRTAESIWADTVAKRPLNERAVVMWSNELQRQGRLDASIAVLEAMRQRRPGSAEMANNLAVALYLAGRSAEAIAHFSDALRLKPGYAEAHANLARVLFHTGDFAAALEQIEQAIRLGRDHADVRNFAGMCLVRLGRPAEAGPHFERAVQLNPDDAEARTNLDWVRAQAR
jgi:tetratricopeptide (TPR) repeat protein